jgi:hypothetical protein
MNISVLFGFSVGVQSVEGNCWYISWTAWTRIRRFSLAARITPYEKYWTASTPAVIVASLTHPSVYHYANAEWACVTYQNNWLTRHINQSKQKLQSQFVKMPFTVSFINRKPLIHSEPCASNSHGTALACMLKHFTKQVWNCCSPA